jgi:hypothetical protein
LDFELPISDCRKEISKEMCSTVCSPAFQSKI